jgi:hypothetical protein
MPSARIDFSSDHKRSVSADSNRQFSFSLNSERTRNMRRDIPDLRADHDITLEHCYVLLNQLGKAIDLMDNSDEGSKAADEINVELLQHFYEDNFHQPEFSRLFNTTMGRGVLIGAYLKHMFDERTQSEMDAE